MANIKINEVSQNYTYNIGASSFATVAMPITACWGPGYFGTGGDADVTVDDALENTVFERFSANSAGMEAFISTYRGPSSIFRSAKDYSYQMALTLLSAGYDVLVCRVCKGNKALGYVGVSDNKAGKPNINANQNFQIEAKYPGTFGNAISVKIVASELDKDSKVYNLVVYVTDASGIKNAVENLRFVLDLDKSGDNLLHISEVESKFVSIQPVESVEAAYAFGAGTVTLSGGTDYLKDTITLDMVIEEATRRYGEDSKSVYIATLQHVDVETASADALSIAYDNEWRYSAAVDVYELLKDKLTYNPQRIISPGWDDQRVSALTDLFDVDAHTTGTATEVSPIHAKIMEVAYHSRCATGLIDIPKDVKRKDVHNTASDSQGYAQLLANHEFGDDTDTLNEDVNKTLFSTHCALFAPWGQYKYVGTGKMFEASPSFQALMIQRAMILNQSAQYEWALPTNRRHNLALGKLDFTVTKKQLDQWQSNEGVSVNVITQIPDMGTSLWGNATLYDLPPATYQALANLSTRYLVNAVKDVVYRCGVSITFQYNNDQAYNKFYAGVTPLLDTMKNVGAIDGYYVKMSADINGLDQVNANTVIGKVYLVINGVVNDINVDLIALPPGTDLNPYRS